MDRLERMFALIALVPERPGYVTTQRLCRRLGVTQRTVQRELARLARVLPIHRSEDGWTWMAEGAVMRTMTGKCRNGHELAHTGRWMRSPTRPLHIQCTECRREQRDRENESRKAERAEARAKLRSECDAGHPWEKHAAYTAGGVRYCAECRRFESELRMRRVVNR